MSATSDGRQHMLDLEARPELRTIANPRARSRHADAWPMNKWKARKRRRGYGRTANARSDAGLR